MIRRHLDLGWLLGEIKEAKRQRRDELLFIERQRRVLEEQKRQIDQERRTLEARLEEVREKLPLAEARW